MSEMIAVIGAGQMGNGIAHVCAQAGLAVTMIDVSEGALAKGKSTIEKNLERQIKKGTLDAMARDLIAHKYDLRHLLRTILDSATYQRSSRAAAGSASDSIYYSRYYPKRLRAEPLMDAVLELCLRLAEQVAHLLHPCAELCDPCFRRRIGHRRGRPARAGQHECQRGDAKSDHQARSGNEQSFHHGPFLARFSGRTKDEQLTLGVRTIKSRAWLFATF